MLLILCISLHKEKILADHLYKISFYSNLISLLKNKFKV